MKFLLACLIGLGWTFYVALLIDRPDMAATVTEPWPKIIHAVFAIVLLRTVYGLSADEIKLTDRPWRRAPGIWLRNLIVAGLALALMLFACREVLNGIDPTGLRRLW
jgi:hypothetical protein